MMDADAWASLLPDLLLDIFRRLESTAVIRCAAACKPWRRAIISNASSLRPRPDRFNPNLLLGFFHYSWNEVVEDDAPALVSVTAAVDTGHCQSLTSLIPPASAGGVDLSSSRRILCSRDGFVLLLLCRGPNHYELCLCNPMTRECTFLPLPSSSIMVDCDFTLLSGHDLSSPGSVRILAKAGTLDLCTEGDHRLTYQVFSCGGGGGSDGAGIWGPVQRSEEVNKGVQMSTYSVYQNSPVVGRDAVYWLAGPESMAGLITCTVGLDICTGRAWATKLPSHCKFWQTNTTPYVLTTSGNGGLALVQPLPDHDRHIQVWALDGDGDAVEWTVQHKMSIHVPNHPADEFPGYLCLIVVCPRSGFLLNVLLSSGRQQLINLDGRASQPVQHIGKRSQYQTDFFPYEMDWSTYISNMKNFSPQETRSGVVDAEARHDQALVADATTRDSTAVDDTDADRRLKCFTERVTKAGQLPLQELPGVDTVHDGGALSTLPRRSKRIAAQRLSHITVSKRGEHFILKRLGLSSEMSSPPTSAMKVSDEMFSGDPDNTQVLPELFPPDGDMGACKRRRRRRAARS